MRNDFFPILYELMKTNPDIFVLTGDLGYKGFDKIRDEFPDRFVNCGAAEQAMLDMACGLTLEGKIPLVYSITPFLLFRPFETIRTYINHEKLPVILVGSGRDDDYKHDGFSHYAGDDRRFMEHFQYINSHWPDSTEEMKGILINAIEWKYPTYINLKK
jgi:transketolase